MVCHFQLLVPKCPHRTLDCDSALGRHVQSMASLFQPRMLRRTQSQNLSCPWCLVPRIICDRWTQGPRRKWAESGRGCQYPDVIIPVILVMVDADSRIRCVIDRWMDFFEMRSRNLDKVCEWFSQQTRGRPDFYGIRAVDTFRQLQGPWLQRTCTKTGSGPVPDQHWITSLWEDTEANRVANEAAYKLREDERLREMARNRQNGRDECDLVDRVEKWCPICHTFKSMGHEVNADHLLEECRHPKQAIVAKETAVLKGLNLARSTGSQSVRCRYKLRLL